MKRRYFVLSGAAAALAGVGGWRYASGKDQSAIIKVLHKRLGYLKMDQAGVLKFADDLVLAREISSVRLRVLDAVGPAYERLALNGNNALESAIRHGEDRVITQYLLSSDFFSNGADMTRLVRYVSYFDPLVPPCGNPFARRVASVAGV